LIFLNKTQTTAYEMSKIVPTISSGTAGPLGVLHMPRFWQKVSLDAVGKLHDDYPACGKGYDQMMLDALGLDTDATVNHIKSHKPSYPQFEAWVLAQKGGALDHAAVAGFNAAVRGYIHDESTRKSILSAAGVPDEGKILDAVNLNNLDDWTLFHAQEIKG
jgi:hypothetical protein